jgi:hypothetical protein
MHNGAGVTSEPASSPCCPRFTSSDGLYGDWSRPAAVGGGASGAGCVIVPGALFAAVSLVSGLVRRISTGAGRVEILHVIRRPVGHAVTRGA